ncbi:hypothetical protein GGR51DRAFT_570152 [Nemania sp. FL0031]|nr:hypothetical protein GGR51DRAFT_570152 [Nemania sp. FL0031]
MAPLHDPGKGIDRQRVLDRLEDLYQDLVLDKDQPDPVAARIASGSKPADAPNSLKTHNPSITVPQILAYLRDNDADRDANWNTNFARIRDYLTEAHRAMVTGDLGFSDPKLRAALEDARVMVKIHLKSEKRARDKTLWTTDILRGQTTQERLLTYPRAFPLPNPDRAKSKYRPVKPMPRPESELLLWDERPPNLADIDAYVKSENRFFRVTRRAARTGRTIRRREKNIEFNTENQAYEKYMRGGVAETSSNVPPPHDAEFKGLPFYNRRGWQRAALQQCLNLFTSHENRVINTPWRRPVLPYDPPAPLPKDVPYVPRVVEPVQVTNEKEKDPFSWLHWSSEYTRIVDFLADCQRQRYVNQSWGDFSASELPVNFRGPRIYRGLAIHDQYWLKVGEYLDNLESMLHGAWAAAPRPLLRAILRDIDAGRQDNTTSFQQEGNYKVPAEDDDEMLSVKRYRRRDIKRRSGIDIPDDNADADDYKLIDGLESAWLKYLCEPSRTLEMCDPSKQPARNLLILFDARLQSYFNNQAVSSTPDSTGLQIWAEDKDDLDDVMRNHKPSTLLSVTAYINGCAEEEVKESGDKHPNPEHPNGCYQFALDEAEFLCAELHSLGRCIFMPERRGREPAMVDRPRYNVHPEDRILWRYVDLDQFYDLNAEYVDEMVNHYDTAYGNWSHYHGNRPRFSRELEYMMDHVGSDFTPELERLETQDEHPGTREAFAKRQAFIKRYIVPEGLCYIGDAMMETVENERESPYQDDLASWEMVGAYLTKYHEEKKMQPHPAKYYYSGEPYEPQTPEKTIQFFRNIAYRMGRTLRHVNQIRDRLQYVEPGTQQEQSKLPLDLSTDLKEPRPESNTNADPVTIPAAVEKWWQPVSIRDYNLAIENWNTAIREGSGEVALLPPNINDVLLKADPHSTSQNPLMKGNQDPFTVIREGIIEDCFQNRPTMYLGRLTGFKDQQDKEYQGYQRPSVFDWATKDQRRYQAQHTRRHFFNMQRWPPSRIPPHRLEAIRQRKDEVARIDPSKPSQAYGILTHRLPRGREKPVYAKPILDHHGERDWHDLDYSWDNLADFEDELPITRRRTTAGAQNPAPTAQNPAPTGAQDPAPTGAQDPAPTGAQNPAPTGAQYRVPSPASTDSSVVYVLNNDDIEEFDYGADNGNGIQNANNINNNPTLGNTPSNTRVDNNGNMMEKPLKSLRERGRGGLIPFVRSDEKFAPGPAVFPMGDTLLQKILISNELSNALYPKQPFYKDRLLGLPRVWQKLVGAEVPLVPLVPQVARANIPRSNPRKRKMPIEFLNSLSATKKFRSDAYAPLRPGGVGGQFAAAVAPVTPTMRSGGQPTPEISIILLAATLRTTTRVRPHTTPELGSSPITTWPGPPRMARPGRIHRSSRSTVGQATGTGASSLRVFPDPSKQEARERFANAFPAGWIATKTELQFLYRSAIMALEFSINRQFENMQTTGADLTSLAEADSRLKNFTRARNNNFDVHAVAALLQLFGERHGFRLQLGVVQEEFGSSNDLRLPGNRTFAAYLVGSKYDKDADKVVVWIRLDRSQKYAGQYLNPYNNQGYNCYKGVSRRGT